MPDPETPATDRHHVTSEDGGRVLVVNAGSSSLKVAVRPGGPSLRIERIGDPRGARLVADGDAQALQPVADAGAALPLALRRLGADADGSNLSGVGHRIVHGGEHYQQPTLLTEDTIDKLQALAPLAPLHLPANLEALQAARAALPRLRHVGVFDTAFHAGLPPVTRDYPLPAAWVERFGLRRYGFHGISHDDVSRRAAQAIGRDRASLKIVTLHLGSGVSATAVDRGRSVDTTMGFTPMEGLPMGTRSGDVDPGLLLHLLRSGVTVADLDHGLNHLSGLLGLSGRFSDVRDLRAAADAGDARCAHALALFAHRTGKAVAALAGSMGGLDLIAFTGGIGENDPRTRADATANLGFLGVRLDADANARNARDIGAQDATVRTLVVPADEEGAIARIVAERRYQEVS